MHSAGFGTQIAPKWVLPKPCNFITSSKILGERKYPLAGSFSIREASSPGVTRTSDWSGWGRKRQMSRLNSGENLSSRRTESSRFSRADGQAEGIFDELLLDLIILRILQCPTGDYFWGGTSQTSPKVSGPTESCLKLASDQPSHKPPT